MGRGGNAVVQDAARAPERPACLPLHAAPRRPSVFTLLAGGVTVKRVYSESVTPQIEVRRSPRRRKTARAYLDGGRYVVEVPAHLDGRDLDDTVTRLVARLDRRRGDLGDDDLMLRARNLAALHLEPTIGGGIPEFTIRWVTNQQHRWGSCTPRTGAIRISDRVRVMPDYVRDYIIVHELIHLVEPGHGPGFQALLAGYPEGDRARAFLDGYAAGAAWEPADG